MVVVFLLSAGMSEYVSAAVRPSSIPAVLLCRVEKSPPVTPYTHPVRQSSTENTFLRLDFSLYMKVPRRNIMTGEK